MSSGNTNTGTSGLGANTTNTGTATTTQSTNTTSTSRPRDRDRKYKITTLEADSSNWGAWKHCVTRTLGINGLWKVVVGTDPCPADGDPTLDEEATAQIEFTIKDDPLQTVMDTTSAKDAWDRLCDRYKGKGKKRLVCLIDKVFHTTFTDTEPLEVQINDLLADIRNINKLKKTFNNEITAIALINALPDSLDTLQTILGNADTITSVNMKAQIIEDKQRCIGCSGSDATAFFVKAHNDTCKGKQQGKPKSNQADKPKSNCSKQHCSHCDIDRHDVADCRKLKREKAKAGDSATKPSNANKAKASAKVALADTSSDNSSDSDSTAPSLHKAHALHASHKALTDKNLDNCWILDSGASRTMTHNRSWFSHFTLLRSPIAIALGDNSTINGTGVGRVSVYIKVNNSWQRAVLQDVLYVPELYGNLLSVTHLTGHGYDVNFTGKICQIYSSDGTLICEGSRQADLFVLPTRITPAYSARVAITQLDSFPSEGNTATNPATALTARSTSRADVHLWHCRLGHLNHNDVLSMVKRGMVHGMEITGGSSHPSPCKPCITGKQTHSEILKHTETCSDTILGQVFSDVCGKLPARSHSGYEYFVTFIDDKSRKVSIAGLRHKSDIAQSLKDFITRVETETGTKVKILCSDRGGEYTGSIVTEYLKGKGIKQELTTPETPQHNGVAECMNCQLLVELQTFLNYSCSLSFNDKPNYEYLCGLFDDVLSQARVEGDFTFDRVGDSNEQQQEFSFDGLKHGNFSELHTR
jgi:hypothetical protein